MKHLLDVSKLEPCEPLERTLAASQALVAGDYLQVKHRREPKLLYPLLEKAGFSWSSREVAPSSYEIYIWRKGDSSAESEVSNAFHS